MLLSFKLKEFKASLYFSGKLKIAKEVKRH